MRIELQDIGKKFTSEWVFRNVTFTFEERQATAILGRNGSGKSTLLQIIAGNIHPTSGQVICTLNGHPVPEDQRYRYLTLVAPYQELIEEFSLPEMIKFHFAFKNFLPGFNLKKIIELLGFRDSGNKQIQQFSSGIKQRVKLALAVCSDVPLILLDEPTLNFDAAGIEWYYKLMSEFAKDRTTLICSNQHQTESIFAQSTLDIENFKP
ncbi:MAG: ABC transporter ATP-binding protein [Bacteroidales bacterium]|nr:ABC transporter ATP-binding protein [Bacteroidales bacterium]